MSRTGIDNFTTGGFGFHVGAVYEVEISDAFFIRPNLGLAFQGDRRPKSYELDLNRLNYIALPLDFIFQIKNKYRIFTGVQYAFLLKSDWPVKSNDFGVHIGYEQLIDDNVFVNLKFYNGITKINKDEINQYLQIGLGYYFN